MRVNDVNTGFTGTYTILKTKEIRQSHWEIAYLMVIIISPVVTNVNKHLGSLDNWVSDLSDELVFPHSVFCWNTSSCGEERQSLCPQMLPWSLALSFFFFFIPIFSGPKVIYVFQNLRGRPWSWRNLRSQLSKHGAQPGSTLCIWPQVWRLGQTRSYWKSSVKGDFSIYNSLMTMRDSRRIMSGWVPGNSLGLGPKGGTSYFLHGYLWRNDAPNSILFCFLPNLLIPLIHAHLLPLLSFPCD